MASAKTRFEGSALMRRWLFLAILAGAAPISAQSLPHGASPTWPLNTELPPEARQFDFWVGGWDVDLRVRQPDFSFRDTHQADARIYPILSGKAVLELWDSAQIKGFSLRSFDPAAEEWVLWLNWPAPNRGSTSSLTGTFRHGRGDFYTSWTAGDGTEMTARYSFNDITPFSLRWDDAFSSDGRNSWAGRWIMEWRRREPVPTLPARGGGAHTFGDGTRCPADEFRAYEYLVGHREGYEMREDEESPLADNATMVGYRILGGCAVVVFIGVDGDTRTGEKFAHLTWNPGSESYEMLLLDSDVASPARLLQTPEGGEGLSFVETEDGVPSRRVTIERTGRGLTWLEEEWVDAEVPAWREVVSGEYYSATQDAR